MTGPGPAPATASFTTVLLVQPASTDNGLFAALTDTLQTARATEGVAQAPAPRIGNFVSMRGMIEGTLAAGKSITVTLRKNGVDTGLTLTFADTDGANPAMTVSATVTAVAGDLFCFQYVISATGVGATPVSIWLEQSL